MSEQFWIQGKDGKLEGSLPEVPKKGYTGDGSEKENVAVVSKVENIVVADKANEKQIITDKQLRELLEMLRKGLSMSRKADLLRRLGIDPSAFTLEEIIAMVEMYIQLRKMQIAMNRAENNGKDPRGLDKFYHCRAHCIATRAGLGGIAASYPAGYAKEVYDLFKNALDKGTIHGRIDKRIVASIIDSIGDLAANSTGRLGDPRISCNNVCDHLWPQDVPRAIIDEVDQSFGQ
ncbi:hypothetical protein [Candidatus Magnetominusculus dajiuhuensis]|uniref:hypothetical protein n=1 Tax=Candidatus Magnetominusculus dajiuhuensis TaxID=3137712 RepID=UPI003B42CCF5